jgi:hypothetical protein
LICLLNVSRFLDPILSEAPRSVARNRVSIGGCYPSPDFSSSDSSRFRSGQLSNPDISIRPGTHSIWGPSWSDDFPFNQPVFKGSSSISFRELLPISLPAFSQVPELKENRLRMELDFGLHTSGALQIAPSGAVSMDRNRSASEDPRSGIGSFGIF